MYGGGRALICIQDVTMYQRNPTYIMTTKEGMPRLMKGMCFVMVCRCLGSNSGVSGAYWEDGPPVEIGDLIDNSMPILYRKMVHKRITKDIAKADQYVYLYCFMRCF